MDFPDLGRRQRLIGDDDVEAFRLAVQLRRAPPAPPQPPPPAAPAPAVRRETSYAVALVAAGKVDTFLEGMAIGTVWTDSGAASRKVADLAEFTRA